MGTMGERKSVVAMDRSLAAMEMYLEIELETDLSDQ